MELKCSTPLHISLNITLMQRQQWGKFTNSIMMLAFVSLRVSAGTQSNSCLGSTESNTTSGKFQMKIIDSHSRWTENLTEAAHNLHTKHSITHKSQCKVTPWIVPSAEERFDHMNHTSRRSERSANGMLWVSHLQSDWPWRRFPQWWRPPESESHVWTHPLYSEPTFWMPWWRKESSVNKRKFILCLFLFTNEGHLSAGKWSMTISALNVNKRAIIVQLCHNTLL